MYVYCAISSLINIEVLIEESRRSRIAVPAIGRAGDSHHLSKLQLH